MQSDGLRIALKAPKLVLRFRAMSLGCIAALPAGVCVVLTNEDMPLLFMRMISGVVRAASTSPSVIDDGRTLGSHLIIHEPVSSVHRVCCAH